MSETASASTRAPSPTRSVIRAASAGPSPSVAKAITDGPAPEIAAAIPWERKQLDQLQARRVHVSPLLLVESIVRGIQQQCRVLGQGMHQQSCTTGVERCIRVRHRARQRPAGSEGRSLVRRGSRGPARCPRARRNGSRDPQVPPRRRPASTRSSRHPARLGPRCPDVPRVRVARATISASVTAPATPARCAATVSPPTMAAADEPSPRPCGTALVQRRASPRRASSPVASKVANPARTTFATRFVASVGSVPAPAPTTSTLTVSPSTNLASIRSTRSSARPRQSNPGPRFALVAGTSTVTVERRRRSGPRACGHVRGHQSSRPRAAAAAATSTGMTVGSEAWASAHCVSLRP